MSQTKVQLIKDGALAEDSIVHDGDTNTKIRFSGADTITAETGGSERVKVDSSGRVGIGTSSPDDRLVLSGSTGDGVKLIDGTHTVVFRTVSGGGILKTASNHALVLGTNDTERARIDNDGSMLLGANSYGGGGSDPILYVSSTSGRQVKIHNPNSATTSLQLTNGATGQGEDEGMQLAALSNGECGLFNAEAERILIQSQEGDNNKPVVNFIKPQGPSAAQTTMIAFETGNQGRGAVLSSSSDGGSPSFAALSDYRIKTNIRDYTDGYNNIKAIPVKLFDMISDGTKDIKGWIAHEVQAHIPEAVMGVKDAVDGDENPILQQLSYGLFMPDVVSALQTAIAKIEVLETKVAALEAA
tara:strand:+ start:115 stop:1185 length:1071 start_codon:yes stop_codon:yes gene_type:complete